MRAKRLLGRAYVSAAWRFPNVVLPAHRLVHWHPERSCLVCDAVWSWVVTRLP